MTTSDTRPPVEPGEAAPDFTLPAVDRNATVSLADYRGRSPVFLALLVGLWCPFCRRQLVQLGATEGKLKALGVESLAVVATPPENARLYFKFRPTRMRLASDPELSTHRAYGVPRPAVTPELMEALASTRINPHGDYPEPLPVMEAAATTARMDSYAGTPGGHGAPVAAAQGTVPDRSRRHRSLGQYRVRQGRPGRTREESARGRDPQRGPRP